MAADSTCTRCHRAACALHQRLPAQCWLGQGALSRQWAPRPSREVGLLLTPSSMAPSLFSQADPWDASPSLSLPGTGGSPGQKWLHNESGVSVGDSAAVIRKRCVFSSTQGPSALSDQAQVKGGSEVRSLPVTAEARAAWQRPASAVSVRRAESVVEADSGAAAQRIVQFKMIKREMLTV